MGYRLYKPKKGKKKEKMTNIDRLEVAGVIVASIILLGWSGWKIKDTFWPAPVEIEDETESETGEEMTEETEPMSVPSLEEAAKQEVGDLSSASQWKTEESETAPETETETQAGTETAEVAGGVSKTEVKDKLQKETAGTETETEETETQTEPVTETEAQTEAETQIGTGTEAETERKTETETEKTRLHTRAETGAGKTEHRALRVKKEAGTETRQETEPVGTKLAGTEAKAKPAAETETETETATEKETEKKTEAETEAAPEPYLYTSNGILNIRKAPDKGAERLGQCPSGITLDVLEYTEENPRWMKIRYNGIVGYVSAEFVLKTDNPAYTPE